MDLLRKFIKQLNACTYRNFFKLMSIGIGSTMFPLRITDAKTLYDMIPH